ncbi:MAG: 1,4-alpha-glucan branching protein GlgB [Deltaproteobacteria bacterium]|nr:1,4-alpha-glucan branching protein GlgB [Deltaproteobacteria bacterium]
MKKTKKIFRQWLSDFDMHLFMEGAHYRSWEKLGAHVGEKDGKKGVWFAVWAPNAAYTSVIGDFNQWNETANPLENCGDSGIWEGFVPDIGPGTLYKYAIHSRYNGYKTQKADPYAFFFETRPKSASIVWQLNYDWNDEDWMAQRGQRQHVAAPVSIYECHLGSWMRIPEEGNRWLTYRELAHRLADYVKEMGFTHVELMPITEYPLDASWGYQTIGYFAPTSRFGTPQDFMYLVDTLHNNGIGVLLDWVPAHFPKDGHGLGFFDGTCLYEHADPRKGEHMDWGTKIFNYGRREVANFLLSNALFWMNVYHIDGLRVDAVASMLYLDYSRQEGEWIPNEYGGRENLEAIAFLKRFNELIYGEHKDAMTVAEESTAWPMVSKPTYLGGLGFGFKWNMGWMHDMLLYMSKDPIYRKFYHNNLTFSLLYAFHENFILPFSHDEVVHGKGSMIARMPGDEWQKFANLRLLYGYMFTHPGKKLLFMGNEFGQWSEWNFDASLDWHLLQYHTHKGLQNMVKALNSLLKATPALYELDCEPGGFEWLDCNDSEQSVISFVRKAKDGSNLVMALNFTPVVRHNYRIAMPSAGVWREIFNTDEKEYGGSGVLNPFPMTTEAVTMHGRPQSLEMTLPPLAMSILKKID